MNIFRTTNTVFFRSISITLVALIISFGFVSSVQASILTTQQLVTATNNQQTRAQVRLALQRDEVQQQLTALGVAPEVVLARVDSMTNSEIQQLTGLISEKPAGSGIIGLLGFILVVLLITDLLKLTNVYNL